MLGWISIEEELPPKYTESKLTFLAAWIDDGDVDAVEWYALDHISEDGGYFWNQNSCNLNHLGNPGKLDKDGKRLPKMFTHWMLLPTKIRNT